ncbi:MAG: hypothetical protein MZV65_19060 [Chromatiales bacterium]|nr:hypothetical protein [Chromatiales bacterium]
MPPDSADGAGYAFVYVPNAERARSAVASLNGAVLERREDRRQPDGRAPRRRRYPQVALRLNDHSFRWTRPRRTGGLFFVSVATGEPRPRRAVRAAAWQPAAVARASR